MSPHGAPDPYTHLEPDQLRSDRTRPLPPAPIGPRTQAAFWVLRVFALVLSAMVIFTFINGLV